MGTPPASPTGPRFGNSPDSGRPPAETTPGGRPDTTTPAESVSPAADVDRGDRPSGGREQPCVGRRRGVVIDVALPVTSVNPVTGPSPELAVVLVLHRAHGGGVVKLGADYLDHGLPALGCLAGVFDELTGTGLLALADPGPEGLRRVTLTTASLTTPQAGNCACGAFLRRHRGPATPGRGSTVSRNGGGGRWGWTARMW